jgi:hypothetical protein
MTLGVLMSEIRGVDVCGETQYGVLLTVSLAEE